MCKMPFDLLFVCIHVVRWEKEIQNEIMMKYHDLVI